MNSKQKKLEYIRMRNQLSSSKGLPLQMHITHEFVRSTDARLVELFLKESLLEKMEKKFNCKVRGTVYTIHNNEVTKTTRIIIWVKRDYSDRQEAEKFSAIHRLLVKLKKIIDLSRS